MTRAGRIASLVALCAALAAGTPARAQNLLVNPDFASDLAGWSDPTAPWLAAVWDAEDWAGEPASGSVRLINTVVTSGSANIFQCIAIPEADGETPYDLRARARVSDGDFLVGTAELGLWYYQTAACDGINWGNNLLYWGLEQWVGVDEFGVRGILVPAATRSIRFELRANNYGPGGTFEALFDHAYLPESSAVASACAAFLALAALRRRGRGRGKHGLDPESRPLDRNQMARVDA